MRHPYSEWRARHYAVTVSHKDKPDLLPRLWDLTYDIETEFGVKITTLAVCGS